jgi:hypothetical protein
MQREEAIAMRKESSMIMGSAKDSFRDRSDSISAFKKFEKIGGFGDSS